MNMHINRSVIEKWVEALESAEYEQTKGKLRRIGGEVDLPPGFCCLGVLCDLAAKEGIVTETEDGDVMTYGEYADEAELPVEVADWAGLEVFTPEIGGYSLIEMNDNLGYTFAEIAAHIRTNLLDEV